MINFNFTDKDTLLATLTLDQGHRALILEPKESIGEKFAEGIIDKILSVAETTNVKTILFNIDKEHWSSELMENIALFEKLAKDYSIAIVYPDLTEIEKIIQPMEAKYGEHFLATKHKSRAQSFCTKMSNL